MKFDIAGIGRRLRQERTRRTFINADGRTEIWTLEYVSQQLMSKFGKTVTGSNLGAIERGTNIPRVEILAMLCELYGRSVDDLIRSDTD